MSDTPTVSIITPTYNRAKFIKDAIDSVLDQSFSDWELLIVDDGSTDNTSELLTAYEGDTRIYYIKQPNRGQSIARNVALSRARGKYIGFLDSDDTWYPDKLERQCAFLEAHPEVHIVHGDEAIIDEQGRETTRKNMRRYSGRITPYLLEDNSVSITTTLVRRECFESMGGFDSRYGVADDYDLWLRFSVCYRFHYQATLVANYRVMTDQISSDKRRRFYANERIIRDFLTQHQNCLTPTERRRGLSRFFCRKARYFATIGERRIAFAAIARALSYTPTSSTVWRGLYRVIYPGS